MIWRICSFEAGNLLRRWPPYIYFLIFFLVSFTIFSVRSVIGGTGKEWADSSLALYRIIWLVSIFGMIPTAAYMGRAVCKDFRLGFYPIIFSKPISKLEYLAGRFLGAFLVVIGFTLGIGLGALVAFWMPYADPQMMGFNSLAYYARPYLIAIIPNTFIMAALFFTIASLTRRMFPVWAAGIVLFVIYSGATDWVETFDNLFWAALIDPFSYSAELLTVRYWTVAEKNTLIMPLSQPLLVNRLLWCSLAAGALILTYLKFSFSLVESAGKSRKLAGAPSRELIRSRTISTVERFTQGYQWQVLKGLTRFELRCLVRSLGFQVVLVAAVLLVMTLSLTAGDYLGTRTYPLTYVMVELVSGPFDLFMLIFVILISGELVWRGRETGIDQICDCMPVAGWTPFVAKLMAAVVIQIVLMTLILVTCISIQIFHGYYHFELGQYLLSFFVLKMMTYVSFWVFGLFGHNLINHKALASFLMITGFFLIGPLGRFGLDHGLYRLLRPPLLVYSDMNGYGPYLQPFLWFSLYWGLLAVILAIFATITWVRGVDTSLKDRLRSARTSRRQRVALGLTFTAFLATGCFIFYNTNILNDYRPNGRRLAERAVYEKQLKHFADLAQPRVSEVDVEVNIFPDERRVQASGSYTLVNSSDQEISEILVGLSWHLVARMVTGGPIQPVEVSDLSLDRAHRPVRHDEELGTYLFELDRPLASGESTRLSFAVRLEHRGFPNRAYSAYLVGNGTFIENPMILPLIGYNELVEIRNPRRRRDHGLGARQPTPDADDPEARMSTILGQGFELERLDIVVSTSSDQIAVAPGTLLETWEEGDRSYYHYRLAQPILNCYAFLSGAYQVKRDRWNDVDLEIYYQPGHEYNIESMMQSAKDSLDYYTSQLGPYPYTVFRIVEFPRYRGSAEAFPSTVPFSERLGFVADIDPDDDQDVDYPYKITAHEMAHQWWAYQVVPAHVGGAFMLTESLANYSATMVMQQRFGEAKMQRFLRIKLDQYLSSRSEERGREVPLRETTLAQPYIHYFKGLLAMYALQDYIGEEAVNRALARFLADKKYQAPPYTTADELLEYLRAETPEHLQYLIREMFEEIIIHDLQAVSAQADSDGGTFQVSLTVRAVKLRCSGLGQQEPAELHDWIDIGVFGEDRKLLYLEKHLIDEPEERLQIRVAELPVEAGIDPYHRLIDRDIDNNTVAVQ
jgi:hypothetical protein